MKINLWVMGVATVIYAVVAAFLLGENLLSGRGFQLMLGMGFGVLVVTAIVTAIPAGIYWAIKKTTMPYLFVLAWVIWVWGVGVGLAGIILKV